MIDDADVVHDLFGSFRAEWLRDDIFKLFSEPGYFTHLLGNKSCVLMGGRGSGKTTVLKCLSYKGQYALDQQNWNYPEYVGIYHKVNTNIVTAFDGPELEQNQWQRLFGHYLNLTICNELAKYIEWYIEQNSGCDTSGMLFQLIGSRLGFSENENLSQLLTGISNATTKLEIYINNLGGEKPTISQLQSPITEFLEQLKKLNGHEKVSFHIVLDEYENLLDYQQQIVNTLIKHSGDNCYFKIGVRELGWRIRTTLNGNESLTSPADYELIHIEERLKNNFDEFARKVCESRLKFYQSRIGQHLAMDKLLPSLTILEEAEKLGVSKKVAKFRDDIKELYGEEHTALLQHDFNIFVFFKLNEGNIEKSVSEINDYVEKKEQTVIRYNNHAHALLFAISDKGKSLSKHYCGHKTFARISNRNIRFYMQLVHECIVQQFSVKKELSIPIDCRDQTLAARRVGSNYLRELEGATARGGRLSKLILGFGRFFQILASNPLGVAPECNQFYLKDSGKMKIQNENSLEILTEAVMHLALVRTLGTKLAAESDIRAWDYTPHPIFSPYFNYSSRRKRKIGISDTDLISMSKTPQPTIKKLLGQNRQHLADDKLPTQMSMFDEFFK